MWCGKGRERGRADGVEAVGVRDRTKAAAPAAPAAPAASGLRGNNDNAIGGD